MNRQQQILVFVALVATILFGRMIPHAANFAPVAAAGLLAGYAFRSKITAMAVPFFGMLLSDVLFAGTYGWKVMAFVYAGMILPVLFGSLLRNATSKDLNPTTAALVKVVKLAGASVGASLVFFLLSNLGTWMFGGMYALNAEGFAACFMAAVPFYKTTLAADLIFAGMLFGAWNLASVLVAKRAVVQA